MVLVEALRNPKPNQAESSDPAEQAGIFLAQQPNLFSLVAIGEPMKPLIEVMNPLEAIKRLGDYVMELQRKYGGQTVAIIPSPDGSVSFRTSEEAYDTHQAREAQRVENELQKLRG